MTEILTSKYFICILLSLVCNGLVIILYCKKNSKLPIRKILTCLLIETIGIGLGAKLLDMAIHYDAYMYHNNYWKMLSMGYTFTGGFLGAIFAIAIYAVITDVNFIELCGIFLPNLLLVYSISKLGCFFNGCCSGIFINGKQLPIQLIEVLLYFVAYMFIMLQKYDTHKKIYLSCILFAVLRFSLEFLRIKTEGLFLSISQVLCIFIFIMGIKIYNRIK